MNLKASRVTIIFNESNITNFQNFDKQRVFIVVTKLTDGSYKIETQHGRERDPDFQRESVTERSASAFNIDVTTTSFK